MNVKNVRKIYIYIYICIYECYYIQIHINTSVFNIYHSFSANLVCDIFQIIRIKIESLQLTIFSSRMI